MKYRDDLKNYDRRPRHGGVRRSHEDYDARTGRESQYLYALAQDHCELVFVFRRGGEVTGRLAWYDKNCLKVSPSDGSPSLVIPKESLKYLYELEKDRSS